MSETAVATPSGEGEGAASESNAAVLGFDSQGALLEKMGLPNRDNNDPDRPESKPEAKPAPEKSGEGEGTYEFGGKVYKDRAAAEHAFSVHRGQAKAASREAARLRTELAQLKQSAARVAPAAPAVRVEGSAPAQPAPEKKGEEKGEDGNLLGLTDNDLSYVKALRAKGEHDQADIFLMLKYEEALKDTRGKTAAEIAKAKAELKAEFDAIRKPMQDRAAQQETFNRTVDAFVNREHLVNEESGEAYYPELADDDTREEIIDTWNRMVSPVADYPALPAEFATTPAGVHLAYTNWFWETYEPLVRVALAEGYDKEGKPATKPAAAAAAAPAAPANRGHLSAPVVLPPSAPRREPVARPPGSSMKDMLTTRAEDNLI